MGTLHSGSLWSVYWILPSDQTTNKATMPSNPALNYLGTVTDARPSPKPDQKRVKGAGQLDFITIHTKTQKPHVSISVTPVSVAYLNAVADNVYHHLVFFNSTLSKTIQVLGCKLADLTGSVNAEDELVLSLELEGSDISTTAVTLGSGAYGSKSSAFIDFSNVELKKDNVVVSDWVEIQFNLRNMLVRRFTPSTKATREIARVSRDNALTVVRDMDDSSALNEITDIINGTTRAYKVKVSNVDASSAFSITYNNAKVEDFDANLAETEDLIGKRLPIVGETVTLGTS